MDVSASPVPEQKDDDRAQSRARRFTLRLGKTRTLYHR
ncbi:Hypothetical protein CpCap5W_0052 [Corynebacterium pseudotuberculosis]|nr:Hypothetical protein Cp3995_0046 [Corynebacterium pseudotuberculosis 3/99-5]AFH50961.1 Hypothetical protein Cp267_0052 [Corynebacterium pseudotuberculosis 267]AIG06399.1 hypothetical protein CPTA_00570 [Corynebacterium pseudotuberculosis]AIG09018.1 hypothetical protein CPTB_00962 [Corynebacterium pseudotuberculosis]AIG10912.1 hypothetical protein CPTC_00624 [Corynebacterium pseudotuberculosis]